METKLTLRLNKDVIEKAKIYASTQQRSLSNLIESYLKSLVEKEQNLPDQEIEISPFVKSLRTGVQLPTDLEDRKIYRDYLEEKYK